MDKPKHSLESSEQLNRYIEALHAEETTANFEIKNVEQAKLYRIARAVKVAAQAEKGTPRPSFAAELERRLLARQSVATGRRVQPSWREQMRRLFSAPRWAKAGAILLLVALLSFVGTAVVQRLTPSLPLLPSLVSIAEACSGLEGLPSLPGLIGDASFVLHSSLPTAREKVTVNRREPNPTTAREVDARARRFAIRGTAHRVGESFVVEDDTRRLVVSRVQKGYYHYRRLRPSSPPRGTSIDDVEATQRAQTFLDQRDLLSFEYQAPVITHLPAHQQMGCYEVLFPQVADGLPVDNAGVKVTLDHTGEVLEVTGRVMRLTPVGHYPIISAEEAHKALQEQDPHRVFLVDLHHGETGGTVQVHQKRVDMVTLSSPYHPGDHVAVEGMVSAVVYKDAQGDVHSINAFLIGGSGYSYQLIGPKTAELSRYDRLHLKVWGTVVTNDQGELAILAEDYRQTRPEEQFVTLLGRLSIEESEGQEQVLLLTDEGSRYLLSRERGSSPIAPYREELSGRKVLMGGTLTGERSAEGDPILIPAGFETGSEIETLQSAEGHSWPRPLVVRDALPTLSGHAMLEEVTLRYFALPVPADPANVSRATGDFRYLQPIYRFEGHTTEGEAFTIYIQAVRDEYLN